jgi:integrase
MVAEKRAVAGTLTGQLGDRIEEFLEDREPHWRPRYYAEVVRQLQNDWKPLHKHDVVAIARADVLARIQTIATAQGAIAADRARTALGGLYAWLIERGYVATSPTLNITPRAGNIARDRVLSEVELAEVWRAAGDDDYGRIVKLLMLTGQRREEIGGLVYYEVNKAERQIELPSERTKNGRPHIVPLSDEALALLPEERAREFVFGRGEGGFSGWSKAKAEIDGRIAAGRKKADAKKPMQPWRLHDLRRSFVTHINERRLAPPHIVEAIVNHISGHLAGVAGVYNKAVYLTERRQAVDLWAEHVAALVEGRSKVVPLRRA